MTMAEIVADFTSRHPDAPAALIPADKGVVLALSGSLDMNNSQDVEYLLSTLIGIAEMGHPFMIDLGRVNYISSTGVGSLVMALTNARKRNIHLGLRKMTDKVRSVFDLLGFTSFFEESSSHG
ncbi:MAG: STAS domain-containing protein [Spirochaetota bacterium]